MNYAITAVLTGALLAGLGCGNKKAAPAANTASAPASPTTSKVDTPVPQSECTRIRKAIEIRDFTGWNGLPAECAADALFDGIPEDLSGRPRRHLGGRTAEWVILKIDGYYRPMASFVDGTFVMFDAMNPTLSVPVSTLQRELGAPAATEDWWYGSVEMKNSAFVYPDKGITLFLNSDTHEALHIALYHRTDLSGWQQGLRPRLRKKPK